MARIRFEKVTKTFGSTTVVKRLDLTIDDGEFFTFVGPSGCGKSTILNLIAGLEQVSGGLIFFDDEPVNPLSPRDRDVAMVFQSYALYPHMTAYENIAFPLTIKREGRAAIDAEVRRVAALLGLENLLGRKPRELSGGQRQRVALGRAIIRRPKVFLMDEPLSNLDARLRIETRSELKRLHHELGITTVFVTHDQGEAMSLSDRIAILHKGDVQQCDMPGVVYRNPANTFVAGFIGSPPMNILRCAVAQARPLVADCAGVRLALPADAVPGSNEVLVGIRPEDAAVYAATRNGSFPVTVSVVEPAGPVNWIEVLWGGRKLTGMSKPEEKLRPGGRAFLMISPESVSLFDAASGNRLRKE
jgi:multiple sugar transport system ATP-binding protein